MMSDLVFSVRYERADSLNDKANAKKSSFIIHHSLYLHRNI